MKLSFGVCTVTITLYYMRSALYFHGSADDGSRVNCCALVIQYRVNGIMK